MIFLRKNKYSIFYNLAKYSFVFVLSFSIFFSTVLASCSDVPPTDCPENQTDGLNISATIHNPLGDELQDIPSFIAKVVEIVLIVGIPIIALAIMYSGFLFVSAQGNPKKIETAQKAIGATLIGALLLLGAFVISKAIVNTVEEIKSTS